MKKKVILIMFIAIFIIVVIIYDFQNTHVNREEIDYQNIVQTIQNVENTENISKIETIKIHITGQVQNPGIIELEKDARISDAIEKAGGATEQASLDRVNLAYVLQDGQKLYIPSKQEEIEQYLTEENGENIIEETNLSTSNKVININTATVDELQNIPGIGPSMAQKIIDYRNENGKFKTIEDLNNVSGIGEKKFEAMKDYITI